MRILGVDPGYDRCGIAVIEHGTILHSACITTNKKDALSIRLAQVHQEVSTLIDTWKPDALAAETLFFSVNKKTALLVAQARGVIASLAGLKGIYLIEPSPQEVKLTMTGSGNASKEQVEKMVSLTLKLDTSKMLDDEIDAIAVAIAALGKLRVEKMR